MKFIGGTAAARKLFEDLHSEGLLCMPYTDAWMKKNAKAIGRDYKQFRKWSSHYPNDQGLVFIDASRFYGDRLQGLIDVLPAFGTVFREDIRIVNPDFIVLNLKTQKMILFGLGRKDRIYGLIYVEGQFEYVSQPTYDNYINQNFETVDDEGEIAIDPTYRYLQEMCGDWSEIIDNTYNALEAFGAANFEYMSLPASRYELECLLDEEPNAEGVYDLDGEEMSSDQVRDLLDEYERLDEKCIKNLRYLQILFPKIEQGELGTGAY